MVDDVAADDVAVDDAAVDDVAVDEPEVQEPITRARDPEATNLVKTWLKDSGLEYPAVETVLNAAK